MMLEVDSLAYAYGKATALHDVSFAVAENEIVTLLGSNGAGKTTTVKSVVGLLTPSAGDIWFKGEEITGLPVHEVVGRGATLIPEHGGIFTGMTVEENLRLGMYQLEDETIRAEQMETVYELLPRLRERKSQRAGTMSGGEQKMLDIARGLVSDPDLLILDEPSLGLMPTLVEQVFDTLEHIRETGTTILLVEQNIFNALELADRGYVLENGATTISGTGKELLEDQYIQDRFLGG